ATQPATKCTTSKLCRYDKFLFIWLCRFLNSEDYFFCDKDCLFEDGRINMANEAWSTLKDYEEECNQLIKLYLEEQQKYSRTTHRGTRLFDYFKHKSDLEEQYEILWKENTLQLKPLEDQMIGSRSGSGFFF